MERRLAIGIGEPERRGEVAHLHERQDRELVARIAAGNADGFRDLYGRYAPAAAGLAFRVIGDVSLAEEVTQDVFLSVWRTAENYEPARGSVRSWLLMQVHHRAVDVVRKEHAEHRRATRDALPVIGDPIEEVVDDVWLRSRRRDVRAALADLPEEQRQVLDLAYFSGLTQEQVAARLGIPLGTVKSRTLAAMMKLRKVLLGVEP